MSDGAKPTDEDIVYTVAEMVVEIIINGSLPGVERDTVDPDAAIDGVLLGLALVMEQGKEFPTNQSLRKGAEQFSKRLAGHLKVSRAAFERTGVHPIDHVIDRFGKPEAGIN